MLMAYHICSIEYILRYILPLHIPARAVGKTSNSDGGAARDFDVISSSSPAAVSATFTATILCATLPIKLCIIEVHNTHSHMKIRNESSNDVVHTMVYTVRLTHSRTNAFLWSDLGLL